MSKDYVLAIPITIAPLLESTPRKFLLLLESLVHPTHMLQCGYAYNKVVLLLWLERYR